MAEEAAARAHGAAAAVATKHNVSLPGASAPAFARAGRAGMGPAEWTRVLAWAAALHTSRAEAATAPGGDSEIVKLKAGATAPMPLDLPLGTSGPPMAITEEELAYGVAMACLLYTSPSPRD